MERLSPCRTSQVTLKILLFDPDLTSNFTTDTIMKHFIPQTICLANSDGPRAALIYFMCEGYSKCFPTLEKKKISFGHNMIIDQCKSVMKSFFFISQSTYTTLIT